jgi:hypothetical protein
LRNYPILAELWKYTVQENVLNDVVVNAVIVGALGGDAVAAIVSS